jgi:hypothetical protein
VAAIPDEVFALIGDPDGLDTLDAARVLNGVRAVWQAISGLSADATLAADFKDEFPRQLVDYVVVDYLLNNQPRIGYLLMVFGIISMEDRPAAGARPPYLFRGFAWERVSQLLHDPLSLLNTAYHWEQSDFAGVDLIENIARLLDAWGLEVRADLLGAATVTALNNGAVQPDATTDAALRLILLEDATHRIHEIFPRNAPVPNLKTVTFTTSANNQPDLVMRIFQGDHHEAVANELLGEFTFSGIRSGPAGSVRVQVAFNLTQDGILEMSAKDQDTGKEMKTTVKLGAPPPA